MSTLESFPHDPDITHQEDSEAALPNSYAEVTVKTKPANMETLFGPRVKFRSKAAMTC
jgi:hypothetical protein